MIGQLQTDKSNKGLFKDENPLAQYVCLKKNVSALTNFYQHPNGKLFNGNSIEWMKKTRICQYWSDICWPAPQYQESRLG